MNDSMNKPGNESGNEPVFEPGPLLASVGDDPELAAELLQAYVEDAPQRMDKLRAALEEGDQDQAVRAAHSLKGMSGVIRSPQLVQHALELEMTARDGDLDAVRVRFPVFEELIGQALESIRGYLDDTG